METPCIKVCDIDASDGLCRGCHRTRHEIACWASYSDDERRKIMGELARRAQSANPQR
jgi:predicted Fe-S protein YdhL (DUF1289 family)